MNVKDFLKFKPIIEEFKKKFPEFLEATDEECFAFICFIKEQRLLSKRGVKHVHSFF